jgi:hypothetical protein
MDSLMLIQYLVDIMVITHNAQSEEDLKKIYDKVMNNSN